MLRRNGPREWIVTILLVSLVIWSWGLGWNSIPGSTHQVEQGAGTFHRRKVRKHRRIKLLQVATRLATQRLIVRVSWCAIAVIALYRSPWSACSTEWPYFLVLGVVSKSSRIETTETENAYVSQFLGSVRIEVPKDDKEGLKLLAAFLRYFVVPPAPRCHGHTLSLREVSQCTHFSPSTVRDIYHRVDAHGLKGLLRKHNPNSAIPEDVKERIIQMQIDDPSASGRVLAARLRESNPESQILAEDVASCVASMDYNEIRPAVRRALGAKSASSYLIDQLFRINQVLLTYAKDLPKSILVQIADIRSIHREHSDSFCAPWTLDETKDTTTNTLRRQWKEQAIRGYLAGDSDPAASCPYCYSSRVRIKEARKTSATTKRGTVQPTESVRYYCMNKECPKKTFTLVDPQRELGAQVTKDVKVEALQRLFHLRGSLRHTADFLYENGKKVSHDVLLRWVQQEAKEAIRWYALFEPRCSGTIVVDEKWVKLHQEWHYVYMAVDPVSHDLLHVRVFLNNGTDSAKTFLAELRAFGFQPTTVVTDSLGGYPAAIKAIYPKAVHIECLIHAERAARKVLRDVAKELEKTHEEAFDLLKGHLHEAFSSGSRAELDHHWHNLEHCLQDPALQPLIEQLAKYYPLVLRVVEQSKDTTRSSNAVERVILEFDRKYDPMQAFSSFGSMQCWCELFQLYYRMRPFKRGKHKGKSPAQVMGYPVENLTWVDLVLGVVPSRSGPHVA